jgi:hypothetical protein
LMAIDFLFPHKPAHRPVRRAASKTPAPPAAQGASKSETSATPKVEVDSA